MAFNCPCLPQRYHQLVPLQPSTDEKVPKDTIIQLCGPSVDLHPTLMKSSNHFCGPSSPNFGSSMLSSISDRFLTILSNSIIIFLISIMTSSRVIMFYFNGFTSNSNSCTANDRNRMIQISSQ